MWFYLQLASLWGSFKSISLILRKDRASFYGQLRFSTKCNGRKNGRHEITVPVHVWSLECITGSFRFGSSPWTMLNDSQFSRNGEWECFEHLSRPTSSWSIEQEHMIYWKRITQWFLPNSDSRLHNALLIEDDLGAWKVDVMICYKYSWEGHKIKITLW